MANEILTFRIDVDSATGSAKLRQFDNAVTQTGSKGKQSFVSLKGAADDFGVSLSSLSSIAGGLGVAFTAQAGIQALIGGLKFAVGEAINAETSLARLRATVEISGQSWDSLSGDIDKAVSSVVQMSRFADEDAQDALRQMAFVTGDWKKAIAALPVVMDLAAAGQTSMAQAAEALSRASEGSTRALQQYGIFLSSAEQKTSSFGDMVDIVGGKVRGFATRDLDTMAGRLANTKDRISEVAESFATLALSIELAKLDRYLPAGAVAPPGGVRAGLGGSPGSEGIAKFLADVEAAKDAGIKATSTAEDLRAKQRALNAAFESGATSAAGYREQLESINAALAAIGLKKAQSLIPGGTLVGFAGTGPTPTPGVLPPGIAGADQFVGPVGPPGTDVHEQMALYGIDLETITEKQDRMAGGQRLLNDLYAAGRISLDSYREGLAQLGVETDTYNEKLLFSQQTITNLQAAETALGLAQQFIASEGTKARQKHAKANAAIIIAEASLKAAFEIAEAAGAAASGNYAGAALHAVSAALYLAVGRNQAAAALKTGGTSASTAGSDRPQRGGAAPGSRTFSTSGGGNTIRQNVTINALDGNSVRDVVRSKGYQRQHARMMREAARRS